MKDQELTEAILIVLDRWPELTPEEQQDVSSILRGAFSRMSHPQRTLITTLIGKGAAMPECKRLGEILALTSP